MNPEPQNLPDDFQKAWQSQASQPRVTIAADLLRSEVERNQQSFRTMIRLRDIREVGVSLLLIPVWFFLGAWLELPWTWYLCVPAFIWIAAFMLIDRARHAAPPNTPGEPLVRGVQTSLVEVEHQIKLLRNVQWWYLLPSALPMLAFFGQVTWRASQSWLEAIAVGSGFFALVAGVDAFLYWVNQVAVRKELQPRREELLKLLANLREDSGGTPVEANAAPNSREPANYRRTFLTLLALTAFAAVASIAAHYAGRALAHAKRPPAVGRTAGDYPKLAPYAAIRWEGDQPIVEIDDAWFKLLSIDNLLVADILAHSRRTYGNLWQKRFEEDLAELLASMGHKPDGTVRLVVQPLEPGDAPTQTLEDVPMTPENRNAIYRADVGRDRHDP